MLVLSREDVRALLDLEALADALAGAFVDLSAGRASAPPRQGADSPAGTLAAMPGYVPGSLAVKLVSLFPGHPHRALVARFDERDGTPLAVMDGEEITAARTAAASALAARALARPDARVAAVVGTGVQGRAHARALASRYEVRVAGRDGIRDAVRGADVVCLCTSSPEPVLDPAWLRAGTHVGSVGYHPAGGELPRALLTGRVFVESRVALEPPPAGAPDLQGLAPEAVELGDVLAGARPGRTSADEITVYKSMGHAIEDAVAARLVHDAALAAGRGLQVDLG